MANMDIYNALCTPPTDALKTISFGALKGKSDINPQWRYEALTNQFGACGTGWYFEFVNHWTQEMNTGEIMVFAMVNLYVRDGDGWSKPIPGWGGDFLVKRDKNGIRGNDEAMKMAVTDALGTAAKMLGVAADVYRGLIETGVSDSKYSRGEAAPYPIQTAVKRGSESEVLRGQALKKIQDAQKTAGVSNGEITAIIAWKYNKENFKALSLDEACDLAENLVKYVKEVAA